MSAELAARLLTMLANAEETVDGDRWPDDPECDCVFVDMRLAEFDALIREAAETLRAGT